MTDNPTPNDIALLRSPRERAARILCRLAGAPYSAWPQVADSFMAAHLAMQIAQRDLVRAAIREWSRKILEGGPLCPDNGLLPSRG
jgi:hypothetical protein